MAKREPVYKYGTPQVHLPTCDKHGELIDIVCEDCDEFLCTDCAKTDHKDHNWVTIVKAASQRRRQLRGFIKTIKEEKVLEMNRKMKQTSVKMKEMEKQSNSDIQKLRKHYDEIIARLTEIRTRHEKTLRDNLTEKKKQASHLETQYVEQRKNLEKKVKLMEEKNSTMSDYDLIENHTELSKMSAEDVDTKIFEHSLRYACKDLRDDELNSLMGQMFKDISATETNSFQYSDDAINILKAQSENESYFQFLGSEYIELTNKQGDKKQKYKVDANDVCVTYDGDVYYADSINRNIARLSPYGLDLTIFSTLPVRPLGICPSLDGGLLVTFWEIGSRRFEIHSSSRRLLRHVTFTGDVIREYEHLEDGQTRLFTLPVRVHQNGNSDICVVNQTSDTTGHVVILSSSGPLRSVYHGQNLNKDFRPIDVVCDSRFNILVTDLYNHRVHLLSPDGEFLKFLLTKNEVYKPTAFSLYGSTLWVGNFEGIVKVFQYK